MENTLFISWDETKKDSLVFLVVLMATRISDIGLFWQTMPWSRPWPSLFDLKVMQPRTWQLILWKWHLEKLPYLSFWIFFLKTKSYKTTPRKGLVFFWFFKIWLCLIGACIKWQWMKTPARGQAVQSPARTSKISEEMMCCNPKMIFFLKNQECVLISAKVQTYPASNKNGKSLRKILNIPWKGCASKKELICISKVVYYLCAILFPSFKIQLQLLSNKKPRF
jgi:hypothetical protein